MRRTRKITHKISIFILVFLFGPLIIFSTNSAAAAYPWNWCPIVCQQKDRQKGYGFEIGLRGELGLKIYAGGQWKECISESKIPLKKWTHVAGILDESKGITLFINGEEVADLPIKGKVKYAEKADLLIGINPKKKKPAYIHREHETLPAWYSLDAIIDELKIYGRALSAEDVRLAYSAAKPSYKDILETNCRFKLGILHSFSFDRICGIGPDVIL